MSGFYSCDVYLKLSAFTALLAVEIDSLSVPNEKLSLLWLI